MSLQWKHLQPFEAIGTAARSDEFYKVKRSREGRRSGWSNLKDRVIQSAKGKALGLLWRRPSTSGVNNK